MAMKEYPHSGSGTRLSRKTEGTCVAMSIRPTTDTLNMGKTVSPVLSFSIGLVVGVVVTLAACAR